MESQKIKPSRWYFALAAGIFLAGIVIASIVMGIGAEDFIALFKDFDSDTGEVLQRVIVPGSGELNLSEAGEYTIFYEYRSEVNGVEYHTGSNLPDMDCSLTAGETEVSILPSFTHANYQFDLQDRAGVAVMKFEIDRPGTYTLTCAYADGSERPEIVLAVMKEFFKEFILPIFEFTGSLMLGMGLVCGSSLAAVIMFVFVAVKRSSAKRQLQAPGDIEQS
ncbi:MAG: hypothetical protein JXB38_19330 [Anaerolineales bacterium]|nr:hypothetical protein [Anaerolineales bacterium]